LESISLEQAEQLHHPGWQIVPLIPMLVVQYFQAVFSRGLRLISLPTTKFSVDVLSLLM
jgi:hypothetical protein